MIINRIVSLPRKFKRIILLVSDVFLLMSAILISFSLRLGYLYYPTGLIEDKTSWLIIISPIIAIPIFIYFGLYRSIIRYIGIKAAWAILQAVFLYSILWGLLSLLSGVQGFPRSVVLINFMVCMICIGGSRVLARGIFHYAENIHLKSTTTNSNVIKVLIYGAGVAGRQLTVALLQSKEYEMYGFIDDNRSIQGRDLMGFPVMPKTYAETIVSSEGITDIFLAMPSVTREKRNFILKSLLPLSARIRTLPGLSNIAKGYASIGDIKDLDIDDLLMRDPVISDEEPLKSITDDKIVMVTGAGGSIGSEICRQVLQRSPKVLLLLEISEYALYEIQQELENICSNLKVDNKLFVLPRIIPALGSVQDEHRVNDLMKTWKPDIIYHAAAYKHVPMVEGNLSEGVKNNIFGTLTLAKVAIENSIDNFVLISTDKAVNPTNVMGASKRVAELILQAISAEKSIVFESINDLPIQVKQKTNFSKVRFGNVLGSSGSVVPLFRKQISKGGPVTLTHKEITRYFMTISEAVQLVMHSSAMNNQISNSSNLYILDMGKPVKIEKLARRMIELSGLRVKDEAFPNGDIEIKITGLRKGEKLHEELFIGEKPIKTSNPKIFKANEDFIPWGVLQAKIETLKLAADNNDSKLIIHILKEIVIGFRPESNIADYVYKEQNKHANNLRNN